MMDRYVICVEGPDRCGKSSQIKLLWKWLDKQATDFPIMNLHFSGRQEKEDSEVNFETMFNIIDRFEYSCFILDRSHIGEAVYAQKYRGYSGDYVFDMEESFNLRDFFLFTFIDEPENILRREDGDSLSEGKLENIKSEIEAFKNATLMSNIPRKLVINIAGKSIEQVHNLVIEYLTTN